MKKEILIQGESGQTVAEALDIINKNCQLPKGGTLTMCEIENHEIYGDYIVNINKPELGFKPESILEGVTLERIDIELDEPSLT